MDFTALAQPNNIYTIKIASFAALDSARVLAEQISKSAPMTVAIERWGSTYIVRAGETSVQEDLIPYLNTLHGSGYNDAMISSLPRAERSVVLEIPSGFSKEPTQAKKKSSNLLNLSQQQQTSVIRSGEPNQESVDNPVKSYKELEKKSGQTNLLELTTKKQVGTGRITRPEEIVEPQAPTGVSYEVAGQNLDRGWRGYRAGKCNEALDYFKEAEKNPDTSLEARMGLAYCYIKLDRREKAVPLLEDIVGKKYQTEETLPNLLSLLIEMKDYEKAAFYMTGLSEDEKEMWNKKIEERKNERLKRPPVSREFEIAKETHDTEALIKLTNVYKERLDRCIEPWIFYNAAQALSKSGQQEDAGRIYYSLLSACTDKWDLRIAAFYALKSISEYARMRPLVNDEMKRPDLPLKYKEQMSELNLNLLKERLSHVPDNTPESAALADEILAIDPQDPDALLKSAWRNYNAKNYREAYEIFSKLSEKDPANNDYTLGLIYTLIGLNEEDRALGLLKRSGVEDRQKDKIESQIYFKIGSRFYEQKNYAESEMMLEKVLGIDPENKDALTLLAWTFYNRGDYNRALSLFLPVYEKEKESKIAEAILNTYDKLGRQKDAVRFGYETGTSGDEALREVSGSYFASHDMPIIAAQMNNDPEAPYHNADTASAEFLPGFSHKSGDSGISELNMLAFPVIFSYPFRWGNDIRFSFTTQWLYSGSAPSSPFVGTAPLGRPQRRGLINSAWVFTPEISFEKEGDINLNFDLGTTPLNGPVFPLPTFSLGLKQDRWRLNIHQHPVTQSILSYVGLEDPYGGREWGRVLRSGAEAEINLIPSSHYWLTVIAGYDYYWGNNVKGNNAFNGTVSAGRTFARKSLDFSLGLFLTTQHFERNSNFFTFGQGGYFSPDIFLMTGPTLRITTKPYKSYYLNAEGTVGYLYFRTEDSPFLPLGGNTSTGEFKGESTSRVGFNFNMEALKLLTPHTALGVYGGVNQSADFTEWSAGLTLRYYISSRNGFVTSKSNNVW